MFKGKMILIFVLLSLLLAACGAAEVPQNTPVPTATEEVIQDTPVPTATILVVQDTPTPLPEVIIESVNFTTSDDVQIGGQLYQGGEKAVILAAGAGCSYSKLWKPFAKELVYQGYTVLTFDFRGRGKSPNGAEAVYDCDSQNGMLLLDLEAAVEYLQDLGHEDVACIGTSMGGYACLALGIEVEFSEIVSLSGSPTEAITEISLPDSPLIDLTEENIPLIQGRKLFIASEEEHPLIVEWAPRYHDLSTGPKELVFFSGTAHGIELLSGFHTQDLQQIIFEFLAEK